MEPKKLNSFAFLIVKQSYLQVCSHFQAKEMAATRSALLPNHPPCWRRGVVVSGVRRMNEVNALRARLVPGWVTVFGRVYHLGM